MNRDKRLDVLERRIARTRFANMADRLVWAYGQLDPWLQAHNASLDQAVERNLPGAPDIEVPLAGLVARLRSNGMRTDVVGKWCVPAGAAVDKNESSS